MGAPPIAQTPRRRQRSLVWPAGVVVAGLIAGWHAPAHAALTCDAAPPTRVTIEAVPPTPTIDSSLDLATLKQRSAGNILHG